MLFITQVHTLYFDKMQGLTSLLESVVGQKSHYLDRFL